MMLLVGLTTDPELCEAFQRLEDGWNAGGTAVRLDVGFYSAPQGRMVLEQIHRTLDGTPVAGELRALSAELETMPVDTRVVLWATSESLTRTPSM